MRVWAPKADEIFPWRCYQSLCIKDPIKRQKAKADILGADVHRLNLFSRDVPSLRWLQMVVWREAVAKDMMIILLARGLRLPRGSREAIKKLWFMLDLPLNAHRLALVRSKEYVSNKIVRMLTHFFLKLDMLFTDPAYEIFPLNAPNQQVLPNAWAGGQALGCTLREKLLAEKGLTPLWRVMKGWSPDPATGDRPIRRMDILELWMRHRFRFRQNAPLDVDRTQKIMRAPMKDFMLTGYERGWRPETFNDTFQMPASAMNPQVNRPTPLLRPDELIMGESITRQLHLSRKWTTMMGWGFVTPFGRDIPVKTEEELLNGSKESWSWKEKKLVMAARRTVLVEMERKGNKSNAVSSAALEDRETTGTGNS